MTRASAKQIVMPVLKRIFSKTPVQGYVAEVGEHWSPVLASMDVARAWISDYRNAGGVLAEPPKIYFGWYVNIQMGQV